MMKETIDTSEIVWQALNTELRAFLRARLPSDADADDVLQDVFIRVIEKIGSLRQAVRIESWVYQIARNSVVDFYRRRAPRSLQAVEDVAVLQEDSADARNHHVGAWLVSMVEKLPKTLRDAVRMYEVEGISQAEIASRLNLSLSGAKSRVQRGRQHLKQLLSGSCQLELDRRGNILACTPKNDDQCGHTSCACVEPEM